MLFLTLTPLSEHPLHELIVPAQKKINTTAVCNPALVL